MFSMPSSSSSLLKVPNDFSGDNDVDNDDDNDNNGCVVVDGGGYNDNDNDGWRDDGSNGEEMTLSCNCWFYAPLLYDNDSTSNFIGYWAGRISL